MLLPGLALVLIFASTAHGQMASDEGLGITGLILDETKTKGGHDFTIFHHQLASCKRVEYTIHIAEQPDRARGSFIKISINENRFIFKD